MALDDMSKRRALRFRRLKRSMKGLSLLPLLFLVLLGGCDNFTFSSLLDGEYGQPLTISPSSLVLPANEQVTFTATGGFPPYSFAVVSGGGTLTPGTSIFTAPASAGSSIIQVSDDSGAVKEAGITITASSGALGISPASITVSVGSSFDFDAIGGVPPYSFSITSAGSGTPTINGGTGLYTAGATPGADTVEVTDLDTPPSTSIATITVTAGPPPPSIDYTVTAVNNTGGATAGEAIAGNFSVQNGGTDNGAQTLYWTAYVSSDTVLGGGDYVIDSGTTGALNAGASAGPIGFTGTWPTTPATYYLIVGVSASDDVNTGNNDTAGGAIPLSGPPPPDVDYTVTAVNNTGGTTAGEAIAGNFTVQNGGTANGGQTIYWTAYVSSDTILDAGDFVSDTGSTGSLNAAASSGPIGFTGTWPTTPATYYLIVEVAASDDVNTGNNDAAGGAVSVTGPPPPDVDYTVTAVNNTGGTTAGEAIAGNFTVQNGGTANGGQTIYWTAYVSSDTVLDAGDFVSDTGSTGSLNTGASSGAISFTGTWPTTPATYYLIVEVAASDDINAGNNDAAGGAVAVTGPPPPDVDYTVTIVNNTGGTTAGGAIAGNFTVQNGGTANGGQPVYWTAYISTDNILDAGDFVNDTGSTGSLNAAASSGPIGFTGTWPTTPTTYYLIVEVAAGDDINAGNNDTAGGAVAVTGPPPPDVDYTVTAVNNTGGTTAGGAIAGNFTVQNGGTANGGQPVYWTAYISTDNILDGGDSVIYSGTTSSLNAGLSSGPIGFSGAWLSTPGNYYLIIAVTASDDVNAANDNAAGSVVAVTAPNIDYTVTAVNNTGGTNAGGAITGNFSFQNVGTDDGVQMISYTAYVSTDSNLSAGDTMIDFGSTGALDAAASFGPIGFTGTWPLSAGSYYLIVEVSAGDDIVSGNDTGAGGALAIDPLDIDYIVLSVTNTNNPATGGSSINETFTVRNQGADNGSATVYWTAYISTDATLDAGDTPVDSGTTLALNSVTTSAAIGIDNGAWPAVSGSTPYFLFVDVSATDEYPTKTGDNNLNASFTINVPDIDYIVTSVTNTNTPVDISTAISETFTYKNQGANNGNSEVLWIAYSSTNQTLDAGDQVVDSGTETALATGVTSGAIPITGTWSASSGVYYLIVKLSAGDETYSLNNYDASASFTINAPADIDYIVTNITTNYLTVTTDSPVSETFDMTNAGGVAGTQTVSWTAYASTDTVLDGGDTTVGNGTTGFLAAGATATAIPILGTWPGAPGSYYLFIEVSAIDETITGNNDAYSGAFTVDDPPDYTISLTTMPSTFGEVSTGFNGDFTIKETLGFPGKKTIQWAVYLSTDQGLGGDILMQSGSHAALQGLDETIINFAGNWPVNTGEYYLLINIDADDDSNAGNDLYVSTKYEIFIVEIEPNNDSGPTNPPLSSVHDVGVLDLGETIIIKGTMDASFGYDTFKYEIGAGVITVRTYATWSTGGDDIDLFIWDENNWEGSSLGLGLDREPSSGAYGVTGWTAGEFGYVGVQFIGAGVGQPYYVRIMCE